MPDEFICPIAWKWAEVYQRLQEELKSRGDSSIPEPPKPLILAGWAYSPDLEKSVRWAETVQWALQHGFAELIPELKATEQYR